MLYIIIMCFISRRSLYLPCNKNNNYNTKLYDTLVINLAIIIKINNYEYCMEEKDDPAAWCQ